MNNGKQVNDGWSKWDENGIIIVSWWSNECMIRSRLKRKWILWPPPRKKASPSFWNSPSQIPYPRHGSKQPDEQREKKRWSPPQHQNLAVINTPPPERKLLPHFEIPQARSPTPDAGASNLMLSGCQIEIPWCLENLWTDRNPLMPGRPTHRL